VSSIFGFPNPVNEVAARVVAGCVVVLCAVTLALTLGLGSSWLWLTVPLAHGFLARVATGPTLSVFGQFATRFAAPRIGHAKLVPGPPKRFAQAMGATMSVAALVLHAAGFDTAALVFVAMILLAATLESVFALCLGCRAFALLMRAGVIPEDVCAECNDISLRLRQPA
jgi:hypothetical protein